ncbi:MAG: outer membrane protein assembly factor BamC [Azonexus sp.]|nr:outer membrane protein assembly factor BamC [Azonexus sp.]
MNRRLSGLTLSLIAVAAAGCSMLPDSRKIDYKSAGKVPTLEVPPDLSQLSKDDRYLVPDVAAKGSATFSAYTADRGADAQAGNTLILPKVEKVRVERSGGQRWLVVAMPADKLWGTVKEFWQESGFIVNLERPEAGVMETDWAENRAKIPSDIIRNTLGRLIDSVYSTGEQDKFRTRLESGADAGTTEIYVSHRGMEEVYTSAAKDETRWQPRASDPELEAEMLRRLMVRLGVEEKRAETSIATAKAEPRARLAKDGAVGAIELDDSFERAWRRVGLALDRIGYAVEDRDRSRGVYYVRQLAADPRLANKQEEGIVSKLAFWRSSESKAETAGRYRVQVRDESGLSKVVVSSEVTAGEKEDASKKILNALLQQLQ